MAQKSNKPAGTVRRTSWSKLFHTALNIALPIVLLFMVRSGLSELAIIVALFSKWRVFAVRPRHFIPNIRSNATDIIVKLGTLSFMIQADVTSTQVSWTLWYIVWLVLIKPQSSKVWVSLQAMAGQVIGLSAIFQYADDVNQLVLLSGVWIIAVTTSRHFLSSYEEPWLQAMTYIWALFVTQLSWILYKWLLVYVFVPQIALITALLGYTLGSIYDAHRQDKLKKGFFRQQVIMSSVIVLVIIWLADWNGEI